MFGNCRDCACWKSVWKSQSGEMKGDCKLDPPTLLRAWREGEEGYISLYPTTEEDDGCGQFRPKEQQP